VTHDEFLALQEATFDRIRRLTETKGEEYKVNDDQLSNFKEQAEDFGASPVLVLAYAMGKHYNSWKTYVRDTVAGRAREVSEPIESRLDDLILYCILAKALKHDLELGQVGALQAGSVPRG
jgi:hypothetical protein